MNRLKQNLLQNIHLDQERIRQEVRKRKEARRKVIDAAHQKEREAYKRMMEKRKQTIQS